MTDGALRLVSIALRRYSREPQTREASTRLLVSAGLALMMAEHGAGPTAVHAAEMISELARLERLSSKQAAG